MHNYTDDQLRQALIDAAALENIDLDLEMGATYIAGFEIRDLRRILEHLHDQQDDYNYNAMQQMHKLQGITGDINETIEWLIALNYVVAFGVEREDLLELANPEPREDQQDDWQECSFEDIRKGDRVRVRDDEGNFLEFTVKYIGEKRLYWQQKHYDDHILFDDVNGIWRLHRPVEHPDPAENPVILVHEAYGESIDPPIGMIWDASEHYESPSHRIQPDAITSFTPAKVVADNA